MKLAVLISLLLIISLGMEFHKAKVLGKAGDFLRKRTRFGDIFLHKEDG